MGEAVDEKLRSIPFKITDPERIPAARYYDEAFFELERKHLWPHMWQMACRLEELPEVGDWVEYRLLEKSVIVVRTKNGVKAFHNACRHRGVQLASGHGNCEVQGFICPFHGWRWTIDGQNTFIHDRHQFSEELLESAEVNLKPCRIDFWGGCAFINFDNDAPALAETVKPVADVLDRRNVDKLKVEWWASTILPTNWKLAMEAFMEGFHTPRTHPQLAVAAPKLSGEPALNTVVVQQLVEQVIASMDVLGIGMGGGMVSTNDVAIGHDIKNKVKLPEDPAAAMGEWMRVWNDEVTARNRARGVPMPDLNAIGPVSPVQFIFPHYFLLPMFGNMASYRIRPLTPETCLFEVWSLILYPEDEKRERPVAPTPGPHTAEHFPPVPTQDYYNLPLQQLGLHAEGFEYMRLARNEEGLISNYQRLVDGYLEGVDQTILAKAVKHVTGPFQVPIVDDIGL